MTSLTRFLFAGVLGALVFAGCSSTAGTPAAAAAGTSSAPGAPAGGTASSAPQAGGAGAIDPCALVTDAEAQAAVGATAVTSQRADFGTTVACQWQSADKGSLMAVMVDVGASQSDFDAAMKNAGDLEAPVSGVGTEAYFNADTGTLAVWQDGHYLSVMVDIQSNPGDAQIQAAATKAALEALGRL